MTIDSQLATCTIIYTCRDSIPNGYLAIQEVSSRGYEITVRGFESAECFIGKFASSDRMIGAAIEWI